MGRRGDPVVVLAESNETLREYYDRRAPEHDDAYTGRGRWPFTERDDRLRFLDEARRVAPSLIIIDSPYQPDRPAEGLIERDLLDGTRYTIYKKYFRPEELVEEIGGGEILLNLSWFLMVERRW